MQSGFNLSNEVTDTLESSSLLIYLIRVKCIYTPQNALIKTRNWINETQKKASCYFKLETLKLKEGDAVV